MTSACSKIKQIVTLVRKRVDLAIRNKKQVHRFFSFFVNMGEKSPLLLKSQL